MALRHQTVAAAGTSYFFFVSEDPPLQSVLFGVRGRGPRARGRCSVTHAPLLLHITYLYLEFARTRRA